ncbi:hypothetical protein M885DRAFT_556250 [Pelagophyceae sp. CCMP2097]|nr:hypothetical protein M885DRAFT_556250 [Pelagophyceae sp. CCMP2097]
MIAPDAVAVAGAVSSQGAATSNGAAPPPRRGIRVADRRACGWTQAVGNGITLGGSWGAADEKAKKLERENATLLRRASVAEAEVQEVRRERIKWRAEAAAFEASRRLDRATAAARGLAEEVRDLKLATAQEHLGMVSEDADQLRLALATTERKRTALDCAEQALDRTLNLCKAQLAQSDASNRKLTEDNQRLDTKLQRALKALDCECRAKDVLLHAKAQKEKHICAEAASMEDTRRSQLLKEKDRLNVGFRAALHRLKLLGAPPASGTPRGVLADGDATAFDDEKVRCDAAIRSVRRTAAAARESARSPAAAAARAARTPADKAVEAAECSMQLFSTPLPQPPPCLVSPDSIATVDAALRCATPLTKAAQANTLEHHAAPATPGNAPATPGNQKHQASAIRQLRAAAARRDAALGEAKHQLAKAHATARALAYTKFS